MIDRDTIKQAIREVLSEKHTVFAQLASNRSGGSVWEPLYNGQAKSNELIDAIATRATVLADRKPEPQKCECELRDRQWNGFGRCLRCGRQYVEGRTRPPPYCKEPQACIEYEGCDCKAAK
jgi:hypothetical protein